MTSGRSLSVVTWKTITSQIGSVTFHFCPVALFFHFAFVHMTIENIGGPERSASTTSNDVEWPSHYLLNSECPDANAKPLPIILFSFRLMISLEAS